MLLALLATALAYAPLHAGPEPDAAVAAPSQPLAIASELVRIAVPLPLSGPRRAQGAAVRQRLDLVRAALTRQGGIARRPVEIEIHDDGCARETAAEIAQRLSDAVPRPDVVIGHPCAVAAVTAAPIYQKAGILFLAAGTRHPQLTESRAGSLVMRAAGRDDRQGSDAGRRLRALAGGNGATAIIHDRTVMARTLAAGARLAATAADAPPPVELTIVAGETDYAATIAAIETAAPAAVLFLGFPAEAAILLRQLRQAGIAAPLITNDAMATREFVDHSGPLLSTDVEVMLPISINRDTLDEAETADALAASDTAAAITLWADAVTATATTEPARIVEHLANARRHLEEIAFDHKGDARVPSYAPFRHRNGTWQRAESESRTSSPGASQAHGGITR